MDQCVIDYTIKLKVEFGPNKTVLKDKGHRAKTLILRLQSGILTFFVLNFEIRVSILIKKIFLFRI